MRLLLIISLLVLGAGCTGPKNVAARPGKLNGTWLPVKEEMGGAALPKASFESQKLILSDSNYTFFAESVDKGVVRYADGKMDIYGREGVNTGKHFTTIYKLENGELSVCYNLKGDVYPDSFETKGKPAYFLCVYKKAYN